MATRPRTRLSPATRRAEILDAAGGLFSERGYEAVSASEVARRAGVTPGLLHHYFGGKRGLLATLVERLGAQITDVICVDTTEPVRVRLGRSPRVVRLGGRQPADLAGDLRPR